MTLATDVTSVFCSFGALIFFIVGCIGNDQNNDNIENVPWFTSDDNNADLYIGLSGLRYVPDTGTASTIDWADSSCKNNLGDNCIRCRDNGRIAYGLLVVAAILAFLTMIFSIVGSLHENIGLRYANIAMNGVSALFAIVGFSVYTVRCANKFNNQTNFDLDYGAGAALVVLGFLLVGVSIIMQAIDLYQGTTVSSAAGNSPSKAAAAASSAPHTPVPQADEAKPADDA